MQTFEVVHFVPSRSQILVSASLETLDYVVNIRGSIVFWISLGFLDFLMYCITYYTTKDQGAFTRDTKVPILFCKKLPSRLQTLHVHDTQQMSVGRNLATRT